MINALRYASIRIIRYQTADGKRPLNEWLESLKDKSAYARILARLDRLSRGSFGDTKHLRAGVWELRCHFGPGYRVYFGLDGSTIVVLLSAGDKSNQAADIRQAQEYWQDYLRRKHEAVG